MSPDETPLHKISSAFGSETLTDEKWFELFFKENFLRYCAYCKYKFGFDTHLAKEVVHTAFIKLWENRQRLERSESVAPYFQRIVHNNCIDALKREKVRLRYKNTVVNGDICDINESPFSTVNMRQLQADIYQAIDGLPEQMRSVFRLSRFEGMKYSEIARHLGISVKTVETQMSRALVKLKKSLTNYINLTFIVFLASKIYFLIV